MRRKEEAMRIDNYIPPISCPYCGRAHMTWAGAAQCAHDAALKEYIADGRRKPKRAGDAAGDEGGTTQ